MTTLEIILSVVTVICSSGNIAQFVSLRAIRKEAVANASKAAASATAEVDNVLYKRLEYLDRRVSALEELACYRTDCHRRFNLITTPLEHSINQEHENIP